MIHDPLRGIWFLAQCPEDAEPEDCNAVVAFGRVGV
jgi:hypothetical protein